MKILVAYFSASGVTKAVAKTIAEVTGGELFEIAPPVLYSKADLDWTNKESRSSVEMNDKSCRPEIAGTLPERADTAFIGFPIWWYTAPRIIETFLENYDLSGATVIPFATSGSSDFGKIDETLAEIAPAANFKPGKILNGNPSKEAIENWVKTLGL